MEKIEKKNIYIYIYICSRISHWIKEQRKNPRYGYYRYWKNVQRTRRYTLANWEMNESTMKTQRCEKVKKWSCKKTSNKIQTSREKQTKKLIRQV